MPTPHISAQPGDIAPNVLMPGDPRRAKRIAETFFDEPRLVTEVRGILGYTGSYRGLPVSVLASGMGMPSMTIYATELVRFYGARRLVRIGTTGAIRDDIAIGEVIVANAAHTDSAMTAQRIPGVAFSAAASFALLRRAVEHAEHEGIQNRVGAVFSSDHFYLERPGLTETLAAHGTLSIEMEAAALYAVAAAEDADALAVVTVTDNLVTHEAVDADSRERMFEDAVRIGLAALGAGEPGAP